MTTPTCGACGTHLVQRTDPTPEAAYCGTWFDHPGAGDRPLIGHDTATVLPSTELRTDLLLQEVAADAWDGRTNLAGGVIGYPGTHAAILTLARTFLAAARTRRLLGDRAGAAEALWRAGRERRRYTDRTTPAPPPLADMTAPFWSPGMQCWLDLPA